MRQGFDRLQQTVRNWLVHFQQRDCFATRSGAAEIEGCNIHLRRAECRSEGADIAWFVGIFRVEHVRAELCFHSNVSDLHDPGLAVGKDRTRDRSLVKLGSNAKPYICLVSPSLAARNLLHHDSALLGERRGGDHVRLLEERGEHSR